MSTIKLTLVILAGSVVLLAGAASASAQAMLTASIGNAFGGDLASKRNSWAIALGGGGAHGIGSELEFSETRDFFQTPSGLAYGRVVTLMPSIFVTIPVDRLRPYGIFGFGFIRQRTDQSVGSIFSNLSDDDVGYSIGGGVTVQLARHVGVRADLRHFKVRKADGLSFRRLMFGVVLGG